MNILKVLIVFFISVILISCSPQLYKPVSADAVMQQQLNEGRQLYVNHCGSCHNLHLPKEYNEEKWKEQLDHMQSKAHITNDEKQLILEFLVWKQ